MKACGIIVEYNPLHNGHIHHINEVKRLSKADCIVAIMSGNFVQRGEPAIIDKWKRSELAIEYGVDLVIELPYVYVNQSADLFSYGAVDLLNKLKVSSLYFGSETNDIKSMKEIAGLFNSVQFQDKIKEFLDNGNNYPSASGKAVMELTGKNFTSNDNLGIQYINSINRLNSKIKPYSIQRIHSNYLDKSALHESIASATAIRGMANPADFVPEMTLKHLKREKYTWEMYYELLKYQLVSSSNLDEIALVYEGIENRFLKHLHFSSFQEFIDGVYTRRYPQNRIRRTLLNILLNISKKDIEDCNLHKGNKYIRILGMNDKGRVYLNSIKKNLEVPLLTKAVDNKYKALDIEIKTTKIFDYNKLEKEFKPLKYKKST